MGYIIIDLEKTKTCDRITHGFTYPVEIKMFFLVKIVNFLENELVIGMVH